MIRLSGDSTTLVDTVLNSQEYKDSKSISIPVPKIYLCKNVINERTIAVKWHSGDKTFLNYQPQYFLFHYRGQGRHWGALGNLKRKGFTHPVHLNGQGNEYKGWWDGAAYNNRGEVIPPKVTRWDTPSTEGEQVDLALDINDWVYSVTAHMPEPKWSLRVHGARKGRLNAYFYLAIGIKKMDELTGCPFTFGEGSVIFSLRPIRSSNQIDHGYLDQWTWRIEG